MERTNNNQIVKVSQKARISLVLAIISLIIIAISYPISILSKAIGITDFLNLAVIFAISAIVLSFIARSSVDGKNIENRKSKAALVIGVISIIIVILMRVVIFIVFIPMLGQ